MKRRGFLRSLFVTTTSPAIIPKIAASLVAVKELLPVEEACTDCRGKGIMHQVNCPNNIHTYSYKPLTNESLTDFLKDLQNSMNKQMAEQTERMYFYGSHKVTI